MKEEPSDVGDIHDGIKPEDTVFGHPGYKGKEVDVWAANVDDVDSFRFWEAALKGSESASSVVSSPDAGGLSRTAYHEHHYNHFWTVPAVLLGESSSMMSPLSVPPYSLNYGASLEQGGYYGKAGGSHCSQEQQHCYGIPRYRQDDGLFECMVNMQQIELGGKSVSTGNIGRIGGSGGGSTRDERINAMVRRDMRRFGALHNIQTVPPQLLYSQEQDSYIWASDAMASTAAAQGLAVQNWATGFLEPVASHTSNGGLSPVSSPAQTENSNIMALPLWQEVTTSQPQMQVTTQTQFLQAAPIVPSSFSTAAPGAWPETQLDYYSQTEEDSSPSDVYQAGNRTRLPKHGSSACDYIHSDTTTKKNGRRGSSSRQQQQTADGGRTASNSSASTHKSPIYKTRRVTRRQKEQRKQQQGDIFRSEEDMAARSESSYQHQDTESWVALLPLRTSVGMDTTQYRLQNMQQSHPGQEERPSSSSEPLLSEAGKKTLQSQVEERMRKDTFLIEQKRAGLTYKQIRRLGGFREAESTLRGRHRTLTKPKEERVRKPAWTEMDVRTLLCLRCAERYSI